MYKIEETNLISQATKKSTGGINYHTAGIAQKKSEVRIGLAMAWMIEIMVRKQVTCSNNPFDRPGDESVNCFVTRCE